MNSPAKFTPLTDLEGQVTLVELLRSWGHHFYQVHWCKGIEAPQDLEAPWGSSVLGLSALPSQTNETSWNWDSLFIELNYPSLDAVDYNHCKSSLLGIKDAYGI